MPDAVPVPDPDEEAEDVDPEEPLEDELLDNELLELLDDELEPPLVEPEPFNDEPVVDPDFVLPDLDLLEVLLLEVPPPWAPPVPPVEFAPPVPPCVPDVPDVVPPWPDPDVPLVPVLLVPLAPVVPAVPPTVPIRASTSHLTTVLFALSRVPFSTTYSVTSPWSTSTSLRSKIGPAARRFAMYPDSQAHAPPPRAASSTSVNREPQNDRRCGGRSSTSGPRCIESFDIVTPGTSG